MSYLQLEFIDPTPDTIEVHRVESHSIAGIAVPGNAIRASFYRHDDQDNPTWEGPEYLISLGPFVGTAENFVARHPEEADAVARWQRTHGAHAFALVSWDERSETGSRARMVFPLLEGQTILLDRATMKQVWPVVEDGA